MKKNVLIILACFFATGFFAEWSIDPDAPTLIAGYAGEQVMPKAAIAPNGYTYISYFDNSTGGYKVYLKLYDLHGNSVWPAEEGLLVSAHSQMTWLTEYDLDTDLQGSAVIVFQDIRNTGVNNVVAYKANQNGDLTWGPDGIALSSDTSTDFSNMSPVCFCSAENSCYFAWQRTGSATSIVINRLDPAGQKLWGESGITLTPTEGSYNWPQIIQSDGANILLKYYHDTGPFWSPNRHVHVAKYSPTGTQLWNTTITDAGGLTAWQQIIPFEPDGSGGGVLAWYEDRNSDMDNDVYCQRVTVDGNVSMPQNGALVSEDPSNQQYYPQVAVDAANQQIYVFYRVTDADQNNAGLARQLLDFAGNRIWGNIGASIIDIGPAESNSLGAYQTSQGAVFLYQYGTDNLYASCWLPSGDSAWPLGSSLIANSPDSKYHFDRALHADQWCVLAWEQGFSAMDIFAMSLNADGSLGAQYLPPRNLSAEEIPPSTVELTWLPPSLDIDPDEYLIYQNNELAQVVDGNVISHSIGNLSGGYYEFYLKARYGDHFSVASNSVTIVIVGVDDPTLPAVIANPCLGPNPFSGWTKLTFNAGKVENQALIRVYNARGQKLEEITRDVTAGRNEILLDSQTLGLRESGVYLIRMDLGGKVNTVRALFIR